MLRAVFIVREIKQQKSACTTIFIIITGSISMRSLGVAPKKRTGPSGSSCGKEGLPELKLSLSTRSNEGRWTRVLPLEPCKMKKALELLS